MAVASVWCGAVTDDGIRIRAKVTGSSTRVAVSLTSSMSSPTFFGPQVPDAQDMVTFAVAGLEPSTQYFYAIEDDGALDTAFPGRFRTLATVGEPSNFSFTCIGDAGLSPDFPSTAGGELAASRLSNHPVFATIADASPDMVIHLGDMHYYDLGSGSHGIVGGSSLANYRAAFDDVLKQPNQHRLYREVPLAYIWDDHDYGPNNSDSTHTGRANARQVYQERVPHYPLPAGSGDVPIYQSWQAGRVLFIASDVRSERTPDSTVDSATKTMLGDDQLTWMYQTLRDTSAEALVWLMPGQWMQVQSNDTWAFFQYERNNVIEMLGDLGWLNRMCVIGADMHGLAWDSGRSNPYGGFPVFQCGGVDATPSQPTGLFDLVENVGRGVRGDFFVTDNGRSIEFTGYGYEHDKTAAQVQFTWNAFVGNPVLALDYAGGHISPPFDPIDDDQHIRNDVTATRQSGGSERVTLETGPLSIADPPDGAGRYDEEITVNVADNDQLFDQAGWAMYRGTVDEARVPTVHVDLASNPALIDDIVGLDSGDKITISNLPAWMPEPEIGLIVQGYTERFDAHWWDVEMNTTPLAPWDPPMIVAGTGEAGPDSANRLDSEYSTLAEAVDSVATELLVAVALSASEERAVWVCDDGPSATGA